MTLNILYELFKNPYLCQNNISCLVKCCITLPWCIRCQLWHDSFLCPPVLRAAVSSSGYYNTVLSPEIGAGGKFAKNGLKCNKIFYYLKKVIGKLQTDHAKLKYNFESNTREYNVLVWHNALLLTVYIYNRNIFKKNNFENL